MGNATKKFINFDLSSENLRTYYNKNRTTAYKEIGRFLESHGFIHRQWSGYISKEKMSLREVVELTKMIYKEFPWFEKCVNKFDVTNVGKNLDLINLHEKHKEHIEEVLTTENSKVCKEYSSSSNNEPFSSLCEQLNNRDNEMTQCLKR